MARNFYKSGGSYYYADTNQKILNVDELQTAAGAGGIEVEDTSPETQKYVDQKYVDWQGQPFSVDDQQSALKKANEDNRLYYEALQTKETADAESKMAQDKADYQDFLISSGQNFEANKAKSDQSAANRGVLFSGSRVQKEKNLARGYEQEQNYQKNKIGSSIASEAGDFQYKYGNEAAKGLNKYYNLGGNTFNPNVARGGVGSSGLSNVYKTGDYNFQGTRNTERSATADTRAASYLWNKGNKLLSSGPLSTIVGGQKLDKETLPYGGGTFTPGLKGTGQIPNYAGDAITDPNKSTGDLTSKARDLTNARNDIATGTTDPYGVGTKSGIAYSPAELKAIESAYAGIYDPAISDVFERLQEKKAEDAKAEASAKYKEDRIFSTNESIRLWKATTGTRSNGSDTPKDLFTQSQLNDGAANAGIGIEAFTSLDNDIKNFYVNPPMGLDDMEKKIPMYQVFENYFKKVESGEIGASEVSDMIGESTLPTPVKHYFIDRLPIEPAEKEGLFSKIWKFAQNPMGK